MQIRAAVWLLTCGIAWLVLELYVLGPFSYITMSDMADHNLPMQLAAAIEPFPGANWFRFLAGGTDARSLGVIGPGDQLLFRAFPDWFATLLLGAGPVVLGGFFLYALVRRSLNLSREGAALAALLFVSAMSNGRLLNSAVVLMPFALWSLTYAADRRREWRGWVVLFAGGLVFGGFSQPYLLLPWPFVIVFLWFVIIDPKRSIAAWGMFALFAVVVLALRVPDFVGMAGYSGISNRSVQYNPIDVSVRLGAHDPFFVPFVPRLQMTLRSIIGLLTTPAVWMPFAAIALVQALRRRQFKTERSVWLFGGLLIGLCVPIVIAKYALLDVLPAVRGLRPDRLLVFSSLVFSLIAGAGVSGLQSIGYQFQLPRFRPFSGQRLSVQSTALIIGLILILGVSAWEKASRLDSWVRDGSYTRNFLSPVLQRFADDHPIGQDPYRVASFQMHGAIAIAYGFETVDGKGTMVPNRYREFWGKVIEKYLAKDTYKRELFWATSAGSVLSLFYNFAEPRVVFADNYNLDLLSLAGMRFVFARDELVDERLEPVRTADRPWNSLDTRGKIETGIRENFSGRELLYIYRNTAAFPRAFIAANAMVYPDKQALLTALGKADAGDLRQSVLFAAPDVDGLKLDRLGGSGTAAFQYYEADRMDLQVQTDGPALLVITNSFTKFWTCQVNGQTVAIYPAYHTFWAVRVPAGNSAVTCSYEPPYALF